MEISVPTGVCQCLRILQEGGSDSHFTISILLVRLFDIIKLLPNLCTGSGRVFSLVVCFIKHALEVVIFFFFNH